MSRRISTARKQDVLSSSAFERFPETHWPLLHRLDSVVAQFRNINEEPAPFPATREPIEFFNCYIDFGVSTYLAKLSQLFESVELSLEYEKYLVYAQSGRAILENVATLRYYSSSADIVAASERWKARTLDAPTLRKATDTLDRFLRGNRFSWDAFIEGRFSELTQTPHQEHLAQVNSTTCLQKWFKASPKLESLYDLFCDLVHPNVGSNLLVLESRAGTLVPNADGARNTALFIIAPSLAGILQAADVARESMESFARLRIFPRDES